MEREKLEGLLIDFIDGRLNESERKEVKGLLNDPEVRVLYEQLKQVTSAMDRSSELNPSNRMFSDFQQMLKEETAKENAPQQKQVFFTPTVYRAAAAVALVMVGISIGYFVNKFNAQQETIARMEQERQEMLTNMSDPISASSRMKAVNNTTTMSTLDDVFVSALVKTMNEDKNTNVRLAALEALSKFQQEPKVKQELIAALAKQSDPIVQIALIQLMVKMKEKGVLNDLNRIIEDSNTIKPVKDEAYSGILKLS
ncbi:MAG TPA: HEAT repeat domain-containing protein [Cyclobacteriaceae bacterium]|nr:HEAT repeat domain-containing protein [Cyclobacteriaceae bacterium]